MIKINFKKIFILIVFTISLFIFAGCGLLLNYREISNQVNISVEYPRLNMESKDNLLIEDYIIYKKTIINLYKNSDDGKELIKNKTRKSQMDNKISFDNIDSSMNDLIIELKIVGNNIINGAIQDEKILFSKEKQISLNEDEKNLIIEPEILEAKGLKINFEDYSNNIDNVFLINQNEEITKKVSEVDEEVIIEGEKINLSSGKWELEIDLKNDESSRFAFWLFPNHKKEININNLKNLENHSSKEDSANLEKPKNLTQKDDKIYWTSCENAGFYTIFKQEEKQEDINLPVKFTTKDNISEYEEGYYYRVKSHNKLNYTNNLSNPIYIDWNYKKYLSENFKINYPEDWYIVDENKIDNDQINAIEVIIADKVPREDIKRDIEYWEDPSSFIYVLYTLDSEDELESENVFLEQMNNEVKWFEESANITILNKNKLFVNSKLSYEITTESTKTYQMGDLIANHVFIYRDKEAHLIYYGALIDKYNNNLKDLIVNSLKFK